MDDNVSTVGAAEASLHTPCEIEMHDGVRCGRPVKKELLGVGGKPVCVMHSPDPNKKDHEFQSELCEILRKSDASEKALADFTDFVFPNSNYSDQEFTAKCDFHGATFKQDANFHKAKFRQGADFSWVTFERSANFPWAEFDKQTDFNTAKFIQSVDFVKAAFAESVIFRGATFEQTALFSSAKFSDETDFSWATFKNDAQFSQSEFCGVADFRATTFHTAAAFLVTSFGKKQDEPSLVFSGAVFEIPERVCFYKTDLGRALFHNCDVSRVTFSAVTWRKRDGKSDGKSMVFDEVVGPQYRNKDASGKPSLAGELTPEHRDRLVLELYQKLKKNYDSQPDYSLAGDFHYGEMEVRRRQSNKKILGLYRWFSGYGENYWRPIRILVGVLITFMFIYPLWGLHSDPSRVSASGSISGCKETKNLTYWSPRQCDQDYRSDRRARLDLLLSSALASVEVAALQKNLTYEPSYRLGQFLVLVETLLTSTLIALFLLAVRRQFKR